METFLVLVIYLFSENGLGLVLTHEKPKLPLYRKQSIDLLFKSIDWFL